MARRGTLLVSAAFAGLWLTVHAQPVAALEETRLACVDFAPDGPIVDYTCQVPVGSLLYRAGTAADCVTPLVGDRGVVRFLETPASITPRIRIPEFEWWDVKKLNEWYLANIEDYSGKVRFFWRTCDTPASPVNVTLDALPIAVPITDPVIDIRTDVESIAGSLRLPTPVLSTLPEPDVYYGLKVNNPAWIAVTPESWRTVTSPPQLLRGWEVTVMLRPVTMAFTIQQGGRTVSLACDPGDERYVPGSDRFPTEPVGFTAESNWFDPPDDPLPARPCSWTPRAKGPGTVTVTITYDVRADAGGFLFQFAPRTNTAVAAIDVTELRTVNLRP